jgi:predicted CoA-binding protein
MRSTQLQRAALDFLGQKRIAVAGVSRKPDQAANLIYRKLRDTGHEVFAVNPKAQRVEGDPCYPTLAEIPGGVDALVIATRPDAAPGLVRDCIQLGIGRVWMHRAFGRGSVSEEAQAIAREAGIRVIAGGCPMMFCAPVDVGHRCIRWFLGVAGKLPRAAGWILVAAVVALPVTSCQSSATEVSAQEIERAQIKLQPFKERLQGALMSALEGGPENAIEVCRERAPEIARSLSVDGIEMGRTSHRLRNPANTPPAWAERLLDPELPALEGETPAAIYLDDGRVGYVEPIRAVALCISCHGPAVDAELLSEIRLLYPQDQATGFRTGDIRGWFWITLPASGSAG